MLVRAQNQFLILLSLAEIKPEKLVVGLLGVGQLVDIAPGNLHVARKSLVDLNVVFCFHVLSEVHDLFHYIQDRVRLFLLYEDIFDNGKPAFVQEEQYLDKAFDVIFPPWGQKLDLALTLENKAALLGVTEFLRLQGPVWVRYLDGIAVVYQGEPNLVVVSEDFNVLRFNATVHVAN